jgi:hypothetical protein
MIDDLGYLNDNLPHAQQPVLLDATINSARTLRLNIYQVSSRYYGLIAVVQSGGVRGGGSWT